MELKICVEKKVARKVFMDWRCHKTKRKTRDALSIRCDIGPPMLTARIGGTDYMKNSSSKRILKLVVMAFFIALQVVVSRVVSIEIGNAFRLNFAFVVVALEGALLGPWAAATCGVMADFAGYLVRPIGVYHPGFAFTAALGGLIYGYLLYGKRPMPWKNIVTASLIQVLFSNLLLNSLWIMSFTGNTYLQTLALRAPVELVQAVLKPLILVVLLPRLVEAVERQIHLN